MKIKFEFDTDNEEDYASYRFLKKEKDYRSLVRSNWDLDQELRGIHRSDFGLKEATDVILKDADESDELESAISRLSREEIELIVCYARSNLAWDTRKLVDNSIDEDEDYE